MANATPASVLERNNVTVRGAEGARPMIFGHGYGTSQNMWRLVAPQFENDHSVVLYDLVGSGNSDAAAYDRSKYDSLRGYANDLLELMRQLDLTDVVYVGHSVSGMIGALAAIEEPERFGALVLVGASPRYINSDDYVGGFEADDIDALLEAIDANFLGWAAQMGPVLMGAPDRPRLGDELVESFSNTPVAVAQHFARVTYLSDHRKSVPLISVPTLVLQSADDAVAPVVVGEYLRDNIAGSELSVLSEGGHYAHLTNPDELTDRIRGYLA